MTKHADLIKEHLYLYHYDPESGELYSHLTGNPVGSIGERGYKQTPIKGKQVYIHWIVWLIHNPDIIPTELDHDDRNKLNNSIGNLKASDRYSNNANKGKNKNNTSGFKGVTAVKRAKGIRYRAILHHNDKQINIGIYETPEEAYEAYQQERVRCGLGRIPAESIS
jgi:hypothetical protein